VNDWRNKPVEKNCEKCGCNFTGKYNSRKCSACKDQVQLKAFIAFSEKNPDYFKNHHAQRRLDGKNLKALLMREYGITVEEYQEFRRKQNDLCAICKSPEGNWKANGSKLVVDHCHKTGKVRGLLCPSCNRGLGQFEDNAERLKSAMIYIKNSTLT
jgi:hypothetical protein